MKILLTKSDCLEKYKNGNHREVCEFTFWSAIANACSNYSTDVLRTRSGPHGVSEFYKFKAKSDYDLYIAHHLTSNAPDVIDYKQAYYSNLYHLDNNGYSGFCDLAKRDIIDRTTPDSKIKKFCDEYVYSLREETKYKDKNVNQIEAFIPNEFIFVALQVQSDSVMNLKSRHSSYMIKMAAEVGKLMGLPVVIKFHPMTQNKTELKKVMYKLKGLNYKIFESQGDVRELIKRSVATFVINSGVGFESLIHHKPVFTYGQCDYNQLANFNIVSPFQVKAKIEKGIDAKEYDRFFYSWWNHIIDIRHPDYENKIETIIEQKIKLNK